MISVPTVIAIVGGIAFLLGLLGSGLEVKEVRIAKLPAWLRVATSILGIIFIGLAVWLSIDKTEISKLFNANASSPTELAVIVDSAASAAVPSAAVTESGAAPGTITPETRLAVGMKARVTYSDGRALKLRIAPGTRSKEVASLPEGTPVSIIEGPVLADGYTWWRVVSNNNLVGWAAEGQAGSYFLEPLP